MITFDGIIFSLRNKLGGIGVYFRELIRHAAATQHDLRVLLHDPTLAAADLGCEAGQMIRRPMRLLERYRRLHGLPGGLLHTSYYRTSPQQGIRNVVTVYDFTYEKFSTGLQALVHSRQKRAAVMRADAVICISENTRQDLLQLIPSYPKEQVYVTHLAAGPVFRPVEQTMATVTDRPFVLFVSGRSTYKNFAAAVEAVRRVRDLALICVGGGAFTDKERAYLEEALPNRYFHSGRVDAEGLNALYNGAVCLVYPSMYEGFGIPLLEAMSAGCPFIAMNVSSIPEVAGGAGILLESSDPDVIAAAIEQSAQPARRAELRALGFEQARKFSWSRTFEQTCTIYRELASQAAS